MLVTCVRFAGQVPQGLKSVLEETIQPNYEYKETDDNSIDGSLSHLVLKESFNDLASAEHFLPSTVAQNVELDA
ncbi:hypothetical protein HRR90_008361 [Exophiala dermatitidis]|uniref:Uncharacterized protein n=1 Tax=Exophiala dermatitidis TaxID=5970 RepID=A0AAN6IQE1_EXODE|nr:hypothetical protein HRR75_003184 [Exophiala dermatitidis]KAJ4521655.1 hypothetical protein HRR74_003480 [Exophiala dermatitidis]KAJ4545076.1 hypothetical protein HRR76_003106 [Exophiala dermatitidis]KAJ4552235.1 hypothetical protein HRR78_003804 [Exophiala dermatitidis]KAJ4554698.1 hypothetical protein HRR79_009412 [Exophiala dermatitidis]